MNLAVLQRHRDALERQRFAVGIEAHGHRRASAEAGQHKIIRAGPAVLAAGGNGLIGQHAMRPDGNGLLEFAVAGFANHDVARRFTGIDRLLRRDRIEIAGDPCGDDVGHIGGIALVAQQMIRACQRHKTLGMLGRDEDAGCIVDADGVVGRRMHDQ